MPILNTVRLTFFELNVSIQIIHIWSYPERYLVYTQLRDVVQSFPRDFR